MKNIVQILKILMKTTIQSETINNKKAIEYTILFERHQFLNCLLKTEKPSDDEIEKRLKIK
jgi:hypothetical protein